MGWILFFLTMPELEVALAQKKEEKGGIGSTLIALIIVIVGLPLFLISYSVLSKGVHLLAPWIVYSVVILSTALLMTVTLFVVVRTALKLAKRVKSYSTGEPVPYTPWKGLSMRSFREEEDLGYIGAGMAFILLILFGLWATSNVSGVFYQVSLYVVGGGMILTGLIVVILYKMDTKAREQMQ